jgi:hypothetical protein
MRSSKFNKQLTAVRYCSTNWLACLNMNIPVNVMKCLILTDILVTLYSYIQGVPGGMYQTPGGCSLC